MLDTWATNGAITDPVRPMAAHNDMPKALTDVGYTYNEQPS